MSEKARYSETKIPLSKIKKDGKGEKELTTGKKDKKADTDSNLTDLQKKIKALTEGKEYTEEVANKVGDVMRQELEKVAQNGIPAEYMQRVKAMYYRSRNHTCIIGFSLSGTASGNGYNMYKAYEWLKSVEERLPVFYDGAEGEWNTDSQL